MHNTVLIVETTIESNNMIQRNFKHAYVLILKSHLKLRVYYYWNTDKTEHNIYGAEINLNIIAFQ